MATLRTYRCECGYEVQTEPTGHYGLFSGEYYNFRCAKCKEIISISADDLASQRYLPKCPKCGAENEKYITGTLSKGIVLSVVRNCTKFQE